VAEYKTLELITLPNLTLIH